MLAAMLVPAQALGAPKDYSDTALNIIPSGQYGGVPTPPNASQQAQMYDGLTPLFDNVTNSDLTTYFKSEKLGVDNAGPGTVEPVPRPGVTLTRDSYNVPHVKGKTHADGVWAAGWIAAEDRGLLLQQARYNSRVSAIDAPGITGIGLITSLQNFQPSAQTEAVVAKQAQSLKKKGKEGKAVLKDIDTYISGINAYLTANSPSTAQWTRNDVFAVNALKAQFLGQGGGDEARRSQFLGSLQQDLGAKKGMKAFNDLRQFKNPEVPTTVDGTFNYGHIPSKAKGSVVLDPGSYVESSSVSPRAYKSEEHKTTQASNTLMVTPKKSNTGNALMVGGPQIGYFYPGLTYEIDMNAGDLKWRGATSAPFPGYLLIGRGQDFATTLTSASGDNVDQYAETLCGNSQTKYMYKGKCKSMGTFNAGTLNGHPVSFKTTVHGPVTGYATVKGKSVAISSKRADYGQESDDLLYNRRLSNGQVHSPSSFKKAAALTPQTFNSFYIDQKHVSEYTAGKLPLRNKNVDPGLPTKGTGQYEWTGWLPTSRHPQGTDPKDGTMTNWNQSAAKGFGAADDEWGRNGSAERVDLLNRNLRLQQTSNGKLSLAKITSAMNAAATQDVRAIDTVPLLAKVLQGSTAPDPVDQQMLDLLVDWRANGGSRLDGDLDGKIDDPGAAIMDTAWHDIADASMRGQLSQPLRDELSTLFSRFDQPPGGQYSGWYQYMDRDLRSLLKEKVKQPFKLKYCGAGSKARCQKALWNAIDWARQDLTAAQGSDPTQWRSSATAERIHFAPGLLATTMRYTNRPSGIQQVISFKGHR
jgi:acyl-homoserine lactone acylase PvdQ